MPNDERHIDLTHAPITDFEAGFNYNANERPIYALLETIADGDYETSWAEIVRKVEVQGQNIPLIFHTYYIFVGPDEEKDLPVESNNRVRFRGIAEGIKTSLQNVEMLIGIANRREKEIAEAPEVLKQVMIGLKQEFPPTGENPDQSDACHIQVTRVAGRREQLIGGNYDLPYTKVDYGYENFPLTTEGVHGAAVILVYLPTLSPMEVADLFATYAQEISEGQEAYDAGQVIEHFAQMLEDTSVTRDKEVSPEEKRGLLFEAMYYNVFQVPVRALRRAFSNKSEEN